VPQCTTPTPNPSPQGGGKEIAALLQRKTRYAGGVTPLTAMISARDGRTPRGPNA